MLWGENRGKWKGWPSLGVEPRTPLVRPARWVPVSWSSPYEALDCLIAPTDVLDCLVPGGSKVTSVALPPTASGNNLEAQSSMQGARVIISWHQARTKICGCFCKRSPRFHLASYNLNQILNEGPSAKRGQPFLIPQKVKGQQSIFVVKQAIMGEVQQLYQIHPCYLPRHKNLLLTFDLLGYSKTIIPFFHWALQIFILLITKPQPLQIELYGQHWQRVEPLYFMIFFGQNQLAGGIRLVGHNSI